MVFRKGRGADSQGALSIQDRSCLLLPALEASKTFPLLCQQVLHEGHEFAAGLRPYFVGHARKLWPLKPHWR